MFDISNIQSAGGKGTELLEENYSIYCDQNNSKIKGLMDLDMTSGKRSLLYIRECFIGPYLNP